MVDYVQLTIKDPEVNTPGELYNPNLADIISSLVCGDAAGIGSGLVVSRKTSYEATTATKGGSKVVGISLRAAAIGEGGAVNNDVYDEKALMRIVRKGYVCVPCTMTGTAGSRQISYNTTTGAIVLGAPGAGEAALYGVELENTVAASPGVARLRIDGLTNDPGYVFAVTVNGVSAVSGGTAAIACVESIKIDGGAERTGDITLDGNGDLVLANASAQIITLAATAHT